MYVMFAGMNMILQKAIPIVTLPRELHLKTFRKTGCARFVAWIKQTSRKRKTIIRNI